VIEVEFVPSQRSHNIRCESAAIQSDQIIICIVFPEHDTCHSHTLAGQFSTSDGLRLALTPSELADATQYTNSNGLPALLRELVDLQKREHKPQLRFTASLLIFEKCVEI
jgi:hypothetical protein